MAQTTQPVFDVCLQDDYTGDLFRFNKSTGQYQYSRCGSGYILSGTGKSVTIRATQYTLTHYPTDRRVESARSEGGLRTREPPRFRCFRSATPPHLATGTQATTQISTDFTPPQVGITAPNGGEIIDTRSNFPITWESVDDVGVASWDFSFSSDGGSTYSMIAVRALPGSVNQYTWSVPVMVNSKRVRVRVLARDAGCNTSWDDSDTDFTVWNPPAAFTHMAEAALFVTGQGTTSTVFMTNTSSTALVVELDPHKADGNATQNFPVQRLLNAGASATVDVASLYLIGASPDNPCRPRHDRWWHPATSQWLLRTRTCERSS